MKRFIVLLIMAGLGAITVPGHAQQSPQTVSHGETASGTTAPPPAYSTDSVQSDTSAHPAAKAKKQKKTSKHPVHKKKPVHPTPEATGTGL
jgi:hypothetical protein